MKKRFILVDTENVQNRWFELLGNLRKKDKIIVFYTENHSKKLLDYLEVSKGGKRLRWVECISGENALDYQLLGVLSYLIYVHPKSQYIIYSNDKGYQETVKKWKNKGIRIKLAGFSTERAKENVAGRQENCNRQESQQGQEGCDKREEQGSYGRQEEQEEQGSRSKQEKWEGQNSRSKQEKWEGQNSHGKQERWEGQNSHGKQERWEGQNSHGRQERWEGQGSHGKQERWEGQDSYGKQAGRKKQQGRNGNDREELKKKQRNMPEVDSCVWEIGKSLSFDDRAAYHALLVDFLGQEEGRQQYQFIRKSKECQEILKECCMGDSRERTIYLIQAILQRHSLDKSYGKVVYQILQEADLEDLQSVKKSFDSRIGAKVEHQRYYSVMKKHFNMLKEMIL